MISLILMICQNQEGNVHKPKPIPVVAPTALSVSELAAVCSQAETVIAKAVGIKVPGLRPKFRGNFATRSMIIAEFDRWFQWTRPSFKSRPADLVFDPKRLTVKDKSARASLERLIGWGFVAKVGPLATNKVETVSLVDFGDALGLFLSRVADLTHMPSSKFTPALQPPIK